MIESQYESMVNIYSADGMIWIYRASLYNEQIHIETKASAPLIYPYKFSHRNTIQLLALVWWM